MEKNELILLAKNLMMETLYARSYKEILDQYKKNRISYKREMRLSPAFYGISEMALIEALSMRLARLYDADDRSVGLRFLMKQAEERVAFFPKDCGEHIIESDGEEYRFIVPLKHTLRECEKCYFKEKVKKEEAFLNLFSNTTGNQLNGITIEVTIEELFDMYHKRFASIQTVCKNLIEQRNKIYAHNDKNVNFDFDTVYQKSPLSTRDVDILLDFAEDYTAFCYEYLSGNYASLGFKNIDDWENTLVFTKKGMDSQKREWKENCGEEFDPFPEE